MQTTIKVIHGANDGRFPLAGTLIVDVRSGLADAFNIPVEAIAFVNGELKSMTHVLEDGDVLEFCKRSGHKAGFKMLTQAEICSTYLGFPRDVFDKFFKNNPHDDVNQAGDPIWLEFHVDEWIKELYSRRRADDCQDSVIPPNKARLNGQEYSDLTPHEWRLLEAVVNSPAISSDKVIEHIYGAYSDDKHNAVTQIIKRLNRKLSAQNCPSFVTQTNGYISITK